MTTLTGSNRTQQDAYVGGMFEVTIDSSNWDLRVHDGVKPGGHRVANLDSLIQTFQARSAELDGLAGFSESARGLMTRLAGGNYTVRAVKGTDGEIEIQFGDGLGGDITISLPNTITGDRVFADKVTFTKGLETDTKGKHTGEVVGKLTGDSTGKHTGAVDVRGKQLQLDAGQIPIEAISGLSDGSGFALPAGVILLWSGSVTTIPTGWGLCDGTLGRPDLRGRFIRGATDDASVNANGGAVSHAHVGTIEPGGTHTHTGDVQDTTLNETQIPSHRHKNGVSDNNGGGQIFNYGTVPSEPGKTSQSIDNSSTDGVIQGWTSYTGGTQPHDHGLLVDEAGQHTHATSIAEANHLPPFYTLAYIIKL